MQRATACRAAVADVRCVKLTYTQSCASWLQVCGYTRTSRKSRASVLKDTRKHDPGLTRAQTPSTRHGAGIKVKTLGVLNEKKSSDTDTHGVVRLFDPVYYPGLLTAKCPAAATGEPLVIVISLERLAARSHDTGDGLRGTAPA